MQIEIHDYGPKCSDRRYNMSASVGLFCEIHDGFCGHPRLHLTFWSDDTTYWDATLNVFDDDDYWVYKNYSFTKDNYQTKVHELLNWIQDMEMAPIEGSLAPYKKDFFPEV